ncbi:hypothetical protein [Burkholderia ubonensis]|nr:hypothetical protein [Burkholderia ubonensis]
MRVPARARKLAEPLLEAFGDQRDEAGATPFVPEIARIAATQARLTLCVA